MDVKTALMALDSRVAKPSSEIESALVTLTPSLVMAETDGAASWVTRIAVVTQDQYDALVSAGTVDAATEYNIVAP